MLNKADSNTINWKKSYWFDKNNELILEEDIIYRRMFKKGQEVVIKSKTYEVIRHSVNADSINIFVKEVSKFSRNRISYGG